MGCGRVIGVQVKAELSLEEVISSSAVSIATSSAVSSLTSSPSTVLKINSPKQPVQCYLCHQWFHNKDANISEFLIDNSVLYLTMFQFIKLSYTAYFTVSSATRSSARRRRRRSTTRRSTVCSAASSAGRTSPAASS